MAHVVWDWNGTLLDDQHVSLQALNEVLAGLGAPPLTGVEYRRRFVRPVRAFYEQVLRTELDDHAYDGIDRAYHRAYQRAARSARLARGARTALLATTTRGSGQSLLSLSQHDDLVASVGRHGLAGVFARVEGRRGPGGGVKAPLLAAHLDAQDLAGAHTVVIGDAIDDAVAAEEVGARCVLVEGGAHRREELATVGVPVAADLLEAARLATA